MAGDKKSDDEAVNPSLLRARMANEILKAKIAKARLRNLTDGLVTRGEVLRIVHDIGRREREAMLALPSMMASDMAAVFGLESADVEVYLRDWFVGFLKARSRPLRCK